jgi:hypothetical protein
MINKKSFFTLILFFVFSYSNNIHATFLINDFNVSDVKNTSLYKYLNELKDLFNKQDVLHKDDKLQKLSEKILSKMLDQAIEDFLCILDSFSKKKLFYNLEIEIQFFGICSQFKSMANMNPQGLRKIKKDIKNFEDYLKKYAEQRESFLEPCEKSFIVTIQRFNFLLSEFFLNDKLLDLNFGDKFLDALFYRPVEVIYNNGKLVTAVLSLGIVALGYFLWPKIKKLLEAKKESASVGCVAKKIINKNNNVNIKIEQLRALQQKGATCGFHAFKNVIYLMFFEHQEEMEKKTVSNENWKKFLREMQKVVSDKNWVQGDQIKALCNTGLICKWKEFFGIEVEEKQVKDLLSHIVIIDDIDRLENLQGVTEALSDCVYAFRQGLAQGIILRSGSHWFAAKIQKGVKQDSDLINVFTVNSLSYDVTSDINLERIINFFVNKDVPTARMLDVGRILDDCEHILTTSDVITTGNSPEGRCKNVLNKLCDIQEKIKNNDFLSQDVFKKVLGPRIKEIWNKIVGYDGFQDVKSFIEQNLMKSLEN